MYKQLTNNSNPADCFPTPVEKPIGLSERVKIMCEMVTECNNRVDMMNHWLNGGDPTTEAKGSEPECFAHAIEILMKKIEYLSLGIDRLQEDLR